MIRISASLNGSIVISRELSGVETRQLNFMELSQPT
jgi:hypothetical protein